MKKHVLLGLLACFALAFTACDDDDDGGEGSSCSSNADCSSGQVCVFLQVLSPGKADNHSDCVDGCIPQCESMGLPNCAAACDERCSMEGGGGPGGESGGPGGEAGGPGGEAGGDNNGGGDQQPQGRCATPESNNGGGGNDAGAGNNNGGDNNGGGGADPGGNSCESSDDCRVTCDCGVSGGGCIGGTCASKADFCDSACE